MVTRYAHPWILTTIGQRPIDTEIMAGSVAGAGVYRRCDLGALATRISNARIFGNVTHGGRATSFAANTRFVINVFDPCIHAAKAKIEP